MTWLRRQLGLAAVFAGGLYVFGLEYGLGWDWPALVVRGLR